METEIFRWVQQVQSTNLRLETANHELARLYEETKEQGKTLYPDPTRMDFTKKRGEKISYKRRIKNFIVDDSNYNCVKHKKIFCEPYSTNDNLFKKLSNNTQMIFN
jgi:hypothetical protein